MERNNLDAVSDLDADKLRQKYGGENLIEYSREY